jgi:hypothetical protein
MNSSRDVSEILSWTPRRWIYAVTAVFGIQAGLLLYWGEREPQSPVRPPLKTSVHLIADAWSSELLDRLPDMRDPTLFALPGDSGFSGPAWLRVSPLDYHPEPWAEPFQGLELDDVALGGGFVRFASTNVIAPPRIADQPVPPLLRYEPHFPSEPLPQVSRLRLEGDLRGRSLLVPLRLRSWAASEILSNSVVRTAIDADGRTIFPALMSECGLAEADQQALQLAATARFQPLPRAARDGTGIGPLAWGRMVFEWHTVPMTGASPGNTPP